MAAAAGTIPVIFGFLGGAEENSVLAERAARGTGRAAVDMRRAHGKHEAAVGTEITLQCGLPEIFSQAWRDAGWLWFVGTVVHGLRLRSRYILIYPFCVAKSECRWRDGIRLRQQREGPHRPRRGFCVAQR